jgi:hypothetical protein
MDPPDPHQSPGRISWSQYGRRCLGPLWISAVAVYVRFLDCEIVVMVGFVLVEEVGVVVGAVVEVGMVSVGYMGEYIESM